MRSVFGPATIVLPERLPIRVPSAFPFPTTWAATNPEGISVVTASSTSVSFDVFSTAPRSEEHTSELQSHRDLHSFPTRRSSDLRLPFSYHLGSNESRRYLRCNRFLNFRQL